MVLQRCGPSCGTAGEANPGGSVARTHHAPRLGSRGWVGSGGGGCALGCWRGGPTTSPSIPRAPPLPAEVMSRGQGLGRRFDPPRPRRGAAWRRGAERTPEGLP